MTKYVHNGMASYIGRVLFTYRLIILNNLLVQVRGRCHWNPMDYNRQWSLQICAKRFTTLVTVQYKYGTHMHRMHMHLEVVGGTGRSHMHVLGCSLLGRHQFTRSFLFTSYFFAKSTMHAGCNQLVWGYIFFLVGWFLACAYMCRSGNFAVKIILWSRPTVKI